VTARHLPRPDDAPLVPGTAVADVHTHTTRSDGVLEPAELVRQAAAAGVRLFSIADHDSLAAYRELTAPDALPLPADLELVPAVEINAVTRGLGLDLPEGELHVLGIGVDPWNDAFEAALATQRGARRVRFFATVDRLRGAGMPVDAQVAELDLGGDDALGRPTVARALVAAGFASSVEDAFKRIIGHGMPGYVPRTGLGPVEAIRAIRAAGGLASLAHFREAPERIALLRDLMAEGLNGLESHHRSFDAEGRDAVGEVARTLGLVETGGTDYHGDLGPYAESHAELVMPADLVAGLRAAIDPSRIHAA
jgi:3',5'-nucleoside bisphosphate phosphatase